MATPIEPFGEYRKGQDAKGFVPEKGYEVIYKGMKYSLLMINTFESAKSLTQDNEYWEIFKDKKLFDAHNDKGSFYFFCDNDTLEPLYYFHIQSNLFRNKRDGKFVTEDFFMEFIEDLGLMKAVQDTIRYGRNTGHFEGF